jgi:hypothetical protein
MSKRRTHKHKKGSGKGPYVVCRDGGHSGHKAKGCPHDYKNRNKVKAKSQPQSANFTVSNLWDLGTLEIGQVFMAGSSIPDTNDILLDSAATSYMFCAQHLFSSYTSLTENETVSVGDKRALIVAGRGSIIFKNQHEQHSDSCAPQCTIRSTTYNKLNKLGDATVGWHFIAQCESWTGYYYG